MTEALDSRSTLRRQKEQQWAKERAETEEWFPFGRPGAGAPVKSPGINGHSPNDNAGTQQQGQEYRDRSPPQPPHQLSPYWAPQFPLTNGYAGSEPTGQAYMPAYQAHAPILGPPQPVGYAPPPTASNGYYPANYFLLNGQTYALSPGQPAPPGAQPFFMPSPQQPTAPPPLPPEDQSRSMNGVNQFRRVFYGSNDMGTYPAGHPSQQQYQQGQNIQLQSGIPLPSGGGPHHQTTIPAFNGQSVDNGMQQAPPRPSSSFIEDWVDNLGKWQQEAPPPEEPHPPGSRQMKNASMRPAPPGYISSNQSVIDAAPASLLNSRPANLALSRSHDNSPAHYDAPAQHTPSWLNRSSQQPNRMPPVQLSPVHSKPPSILMDQVSIVDGQSLISLGGVSDPAGYNSKTRRSNKITDFRDSTQIEFERVRIKQNKELIELQLQDKKRREMIESRREQMDEERIVRDHEAMENRQAQENELELTKWKQQEDQLRERQMKVQQAIEDAAREAERVKREKLYKHAKKGGPDSDGSSGHQQATPSPQAPPRRGSVSGPAIHDQEEPMRLLDRSQNDMRPHKSFEQLNVDVTNPQINGVVAMPQPQQNRGMQQRRAARLATQAQVATTDSSDSLGTSASRESPPSRMQQRPKKTPGSATKKNSPASLSSSLRSSSQGNVPTSSTNVSVASPATEYDDRPIRPQQLDPIALWEQIGGDPVGSPVVMAKEEKAPARVERRKSVDSVQANTSTMLKPTPGSTPLRKVNGIVQRRGKSIDPSNKVSDSKPVPPVQATHQQVKTQAPRLHSNSESSNGSWEMEVIASQRAAAANQKRLQSAASTFTVGSRGTYVVDESEKSEPLVTSQIPPDQTSKSPTKKSLEEHPVKPSLTTPVGDRNGSVIENPFGDSLGGANPLIQPIATRSRRLKERQSVDTVPSSQSERIESEKIDAVKNLPIENVVENVPQTAPMVIAAAQPDADTLPQSKPRENLISPKKIVVSEARTNIPQRPKVSAPEPAFSRLQQRRASLSAKSSHLDNAKQQNLLQQLQLMRSQLKNKQIAIEQAFLQSPRSMKGSPTKSPSQSES